MKRPPLFHRPAVVQLPDAVRAIEERLAKVTAPDGVTFHRDRQQRRIDAPQKTARIR